MKRTTGNTPGDAAAGDGKSFETMMERLEQLVERLEEGNLSLEDSIKSFEEGMTLVKTCSKVLQEAEQRIQKLTREAEAKPAPESGARSRLGADEGELPF